MFTLYCRYFKDAQNDFHPQIIKKTTEKSHIFVIKVKIEK